MKRNIYLLFSNVKVEFMKILCDWKLYVSILLYVLIVLLVNKGRAGNPVNSINNMTGLSNMNRLLVLMSSFTTATLYSDEYLDGAVMYRSLRCGRRVIFMSKLIATVVCSFFVAWTGLNIAMFIIYVKAGKIGAGSMSEYNSLYYLAVGKFPFAYILVRDYMYAMVSSMWAVAGLMLSAFFTDRFMAVFAPVFASVFMEELLNAVVSVPAVVDPFTIQCMDAYMDKGFLYTVVFSTLPIAAYTAVFALMFVRKAMKEGGYTIESD